MSEVHIITLIKNFDNFMFCGKKNPSFSGDTWVSPYEVTKNIHPIEIVTCKACHDLYVLEMLAES